MSIHGAGVVIRQWREKKGRTLQHLATLFGCSRAFVSMVELGKKPLPEAWLAKLPIEVKDDVAYAAHEYLQNLIERG